MKAITKIALVVATMFAFTPVSRADVIYPNLIINGSFETPDIPQGVAYGPVGGWATYYSYTPELGWTPTSGGMEILDRVIADIVGGVNVVWYASDGDQFAEMDANSNGGMYQLVNTNIGQQYTLSFEYSPLPGVLPESNIIDLYIDGLVVDSLTGSGVGEYYPVWSLNSYSFIATETSTEIKFLAGGVSDSLGGFLDDVQLRATAMPVPEPSTLLLLGSGLVGLVGFGRKRLKM